ncbi:MAG: RAD55 family ATPase [Candidatus Aenigmatarchaeota archaeon]
MARKMKKKVAKRGVKKKTRKKRSVERIPTGIKGLDRFMKGGLIKGTTTLLTGSTGTGKTIFCTQFILEGLRKKEKCLFITMEERVEDIINDVKEFKWDLRKHMDSGLLILEYRDPFQLANLAEKLAERIKKNKIQRVVIDSTSLFGLYFKDPFDVRKQLFNLMAKLKSSGATTILTSEMPEADHMLSRFGVEEYITDNVIILNYLGVGGVYGRSLSIRKMRRTDHGKDVYPLKIGKRGIEIRGAERGIKL